MGYLGNMITAAGSAISAFRESILNADPASGRAMLSGKVDGWGQPESRTLRYNLNWAMYQNNAYRDLVHFWSAKFKSSSGVYKHIRHIYNPAGQMGDFWAGHLWGGTLDREAGDGETAPSALPILADNEALRPAIARLRRDSRWQVNKDVFTLWGSVLGDAAIRIVDDARRGQIRKELVHPSHLAWCDFDEQRNVKGYEIRKWVDDPRSAPDASGHRKPALYTERCRRDGDMVVYETFIDGSKPYPWNGKDEWWAEPYGFVPLVVVNHRSIGLDWGANCFHGSLPQFVEVDDQASCLSDCNRKTLNGPWYMAGAKGPSQITAAGTDRATRAAHENGGNPEPARAELNFLYGPDGSTATSLTSPADIPGMYAYIAGLITSIEKRHPELLADAGLAGTVTAEAVRNARQLASSKVQAIRPGYDDAEVRTNQMALALGGLRGYEGYAGFGLDSYSAGKLDHQVGHRPVFEVDPIDAIAEDQAFWTAAGAARKAGCPLPLYLERNGWSEQDIKALADARAAEPPPVAMLPGGKSIPELGAKG